MSTVDQRATGYARLVAEYRIDDLARAAGTSVRNVRVYQDRELLAPPSKRGRTAIYGDAHLARLRLILNMLDRGYAFAQIKEMLDAWQSGHSLADVLGLEEATGAASSHERPAVMAMTDLVRMFGTQVTPSNIRKALEVGALERHGLQFVAPSPKLLDSGAELVSLAVPLSEALELAAELQKETDRVTGMLVELVRKYVLDPKGPDWLPSGDELPHFADVISRLHPLVMSALSAAVDRSARRMIPQIMGDRLIAMAERVRAERGE
jgi:DNA-binding transcriptional MerR regulator